MARVDTVNQVNSHAAMNELSELRGQSPFLHFLGPCRLFFKVQCLQVYVLG